MPARRIAPLAPIGSDSGNFFCARRSRTAGTPGYPLRDRSHSAFTPGQPHHLKAHSCVTSSSPTRHQTSTFLSPSTATPLPCWWWRTAEPGVLVALPARIWILSSVPGGRTDFVDLIRDTGRRASKGLGGGTYGFGKAVLCQASAVSTIVIYSRTGLERPQSSRLIAMAIGNDEYLEHGVRYTGRHWWGIIDDGVAEPVLGAGRRCCGSRPGPAGAYQRSDWDRCDGDCSSHARG